jgi:hypothetical protein
MKDMMKYIRIEHPHGFRMRKIDYISIITDEDGQTWLVDSSNDGGTLEVRLKFEPDHYLERFKSDDMIVITEHELD